MMRWVIVHRVRGEIRYFMAPEPYGREPSEWGTVYNARRATLLMKQYLDGLALDEIQVERSTTHRADADAPTKHT